MLTSFFENGRRGKLLQGEFFMRSMRLQVIKPIFLVIAMALFAAIPEAAPQHPPDYSQLFDKTEAMIRARDGAKLHTDIYSPKKISEPLPILLYPTPSRISHTNPG